MSRGWLVRGSSLVLGLLSLGALVVSCADDGAPGCSSGCANGWTLCQSQLTGSGITQSQFQSNCQAQCERSAASNARNLATQLSCLNQATDCTTAEECGPFSTVLVPPLGFAGFTDASIFGNGGFGASPFNTGGFFETGGRIGGGGFLGCSDDCFYAANGVCEDGGPNSSSVRCSYGTDCSDCGVRAFGTGGFAGTGGTGNTDAGRFDGAAGSTDASGTPDGNANMDGSRSDGAFSTDSATGADATTVDGALRRD